MDILQALYDSEINFNMACFWDGGIDWKLGDEINGFKAMGCNETVEEAINAIGIAALTHYEKSTFAKNYWLIGGKVCKRYEATGVFTKPVQEVPQYRVYFTNSGPMLTEPNIISSNGWHVTE